MEYDLSGTYISSSGAETEFYTYKLKSDSFITVRLPMLISGGVNRAQDLVISLTYDLGTTFHVTIDEFINFKTTVINRNVNWSVKNKAGKTVEIPGKWTSSREFDPLGGLPVTKANKNESKGGIPMNTYTGGRRSRKHSRRTNNKSKKSKKTKKSNKPKKSKRV